MERYRILVLLVICLFVQLSSTAETLQCGVEKTWNVDSAREEAFENLKPTLDLSWIPAIDSNLIANKQAISNHQRKVGNRVVNSYSDGGYGVWILDEDNYDKIYYYSSAGKLISIDFTIYPDDIQNLQTYFKKQELQQIYPIKNYKHAYPSGKLVSISLTVNDKEVYGFMPSGKLAYHWLGTNCYDVNGKKVLMTKKRS